jgi:hypothetical protein
LYQLEIVLSLKYRNSFKPSCFDCFIYSKYCTSIFSPESSGSFYIRSFSYIYIASFAPASSVVQSRQLMLPLSAALASREVLHIIFIPSSINISRILYALWIGVLSYIKILLYSRIIGRYSRKIFIYTRAITPPF